MNEGTLTHDCSQTSGFGIGVSEVELTRNQITAVVVAQMASIVMQA